MKCHYCEKNESGERLGLIRTDTCLRRTNERPYKKSTLTCLCAVTLLMWANPVRADLLPNNFWVNPSFELGTNLGQITGTVSNWNRGGNAPAICQVITSNSVSFNHSLALIDTAPGDAYGEWYSDLSLAGNAAPGDALDLQWFEMYNLSGPEMRFSVLFFDAADSLVGTTDFVTSGTSSPGWVSTIEDSTFTRRNAFLLVPVGAIKMRCSLVSGGSGIITGVMAIDDLSIRLRQLTISDITAEVSGVALTWASAPAKTYTVLFTGALGPTQTWTPVVIGLPSKGLTTSYLVTAPPHGQRGLLPRGRGVKVARAA